MIIWRILPLKHFSNVLELNRPEFEWKIEKMANGLFFLFGWFNPMCKGIRNDSMLLCKATPQVIIFNKKWIECDRDKNEHLLMRNHHFLFIYYYSYMINIFPMNGKSCLHTIHTNRTHFAKNGWIRLSLFRRSFHSYVTVTDTFATFSVWWTFYKWSHKK